MKKEEKIEGLKKEIQAKESQIIRLNSKLPGLAKMAKTGGRESIENYQSTAAALGRLKQEYKDSVEELSRLQTEMDLKKYPKLVKARTEMLEKRKALAELEQESSALSKSWIAQVRIVDSLKQESEKSITTSNFEQVQAAEIELSNQKKKLFEIASRLKELKTSIQESKEACYQAEKELSTAYREHVSTDIRKADKLLSEALEVYKRVNDCAKRTGKTRMLRGFLVPNPCSESQIHDIDVLIAELEKFQS